MRVEQIRSKEIYKNPKAFYKLTLVEGHMNRWIREREIAVACVQKWKGRVVGWGCLVSEYEFDTYTIGVFVHPRHRRKHYGLKIVKFLKRYAKKHRYEIQAEPHDIASDELYEKAKLI